MTTAKVEFKIGDIEFQGEGEQEWVTEQLDKMLDKFPKLLHLAPAKSDDMPNANGNTNGTTNNSSETSQKPLATFLKDRSATTNQIRKFLVTAFWLHSRGKSRLSTSDVSSALKDSNQSRLGNASECLNQNLSKGFCEKDGSSFFVTEEGKTEVLGK